MICHKMYLCTHLQPNLIFKYCKTNTFCVTILDTMLQKIARREVVEFYNFSSRFTLTVYSILDEEKVQQSLEGDT